MFRPGLAGWETAATPRAQAVPLLPRCSAARTPKSSRAAKRALERIRPRSRQTRAECRRTEVVTHFLPFLREGTSCPCGASHVAVSELADDEAVPPVAAMLGDPQLQEDARMVLERLPGKESLRR